MKYTKSYYFLVILLLFTCKLTFAQQAQDMFGKNRIQYKNFRWEYLSTDNFDIYFYFGGRESAIYASKYAELDLPRLVEMVGFASDQKIKLLVYNSSHDLLQSNIGFDEPNPAAGGQTNFVKSKVEVAFRGNHTDFRKEINQEVARLLINEMFYGGRLRDIIRNAYVMNIPQWYIGGAASYLGYGWSQEMDSFMRDYFAQRRQKSFYLAEGREAELLGMSFWNFIVERYGKANMANILNITQYTKNEQKAITNVLGITFDQFLKEWKDYYKQMYRNLPETLTDPDLSLCLRKRNKKTRVYDRISMSNTGEYVVYTQNIKGRYKVKRYHIGTRRTKTLTKGGYKTVDQKPDRSMPLVSVGQDIIGVVELKRKKIFLTSYTSNGKKKDRVPLAGFENILDFDFSDDGNAIVFSGQKDGESDLHYYNFKDNVYRQLTMDFADDLHPQFLRGTREIVFSSNRKEDTLRPKTIVADRVKIKDYFEDYDLFIYPEITGSKKLIRLTDDVDNQTHPVPYDANTLLYLSNENGIRALYKMNLETKESVQVSSFVEDIKDYDVFPGSNTISYVMIAKSKEHVFVDKAFDFNKEYYFEPTERISMLNARKKAFKKQEVIDDEPKKKKDEDIDPDDLLSDDEKEIDIENYTFESEAKQKKEQEEKERIKKDKPAEDLINTVGPTNYTGILSIDNLVTGLAFDNLRGFGITVDASMSDMLGNHRFNGGLWGSTDFATSNMYVEYLYLKRRVDFKVRYEKKALSAVQENQYQKYKIDHFEFGMAYPITNAARISFTPVFFATRFLQVYPPGASNADETRYYSGFKTEYVYDNTISVNMNMPQGTRIKLIYENYATNQTPNLNFSRINADLRNYLRLHRELVFATRFSGGHYFGQDPKNFLFGGVDNWVNANKNTSGTDNPFRYAQDYDNINLLMSPFVTGVRGFRHGEMWGQNYFLMNLELRLPVVRYLVHGNISSSFFRNLQLIGFMDYGAAWTGTNPFNKENTFNTRIVDGKPFEVKVTNFDNPFLTSYGAGLRSYLLGYYIKCDLAWPIKDYVSQTPTILVSLGHDF